MPFVTPPTAVSGSIVQAQHRNVLRNNDLWFNALVPAPSAANQVPALVSPLAGAWAKLATASFQTGAVGTAELADGAVTTAKIVQDAPALDRLASAVATALYPTGLIQMVRTAAEIPAGWEREDDLDGRMIVHDGTTFSVAWVAGQDYGTSWAHDHPVSVTTGQPSDINPILIVDAPAASGATTTHTHTITGTTDDTSWAIPSRAYVFCRFDP